MCKGIWGIVLLAAMLVVENVEAETRSDNKPVCNTGDSTKPLAEIEPRRLSDVIAVYNCWSADTTNASQYYLNDLYSRWIIEEVYQPDLKLVRDYDAEHRHWVVRSMVGGSRAAVMTVRIKMRDPEVEFTVPLMSVDYSGKAGEGETFSTSFLSSEMGLPDFRLSPNTSVSVEASARITKDVDVQSTGIVLGALKDSLSIIAPGGSLLTSVNREQVQRVSTAYDSALSKLLSSTVAESAVTGRLTSEWYPASSIMVSVGIPKGVRIAGSDPKNSGTPPRIWFRLTMACPRVSIFDTTNVCATGVNGSPNMRTLLNSPYHQVDSKKTDPDHIVGDPGTESDAYQKIVADLPRRVNATQVLSFRVGPGRTIRQYLTEQEWFIALSKKMVDPEPKVNASIINETASQATAAQNAAANGTNLTTDQKKVSDARASAAQFCDAVVEKLYTSGLSLLDARIGLWAVASGLPDFAPSRGVFDKVPGCIANLPDGGRGRWPVTDGVTPAR